MMRQKKVEPEVGSQLVLWLSDCHVKSTTDYFTQWMDGWMDVMMVEMNGRLHGHVHSQSRLIRHIACTVKSRFN